MKILAALLVAAVASAAPLVSASAQQAPGSSQPSRAPALGVPDLQDDQLDLWIAKSNASVKLLNVSLRAKESYSRYASWVDLKKGPTGRERIIYGLYSVSASQVADAVAGARKSAAAEPAIPELDQAVLEMAAALEAAVPVINEAEAYYERQDYKTDNAEGARSLHARLMPAFATLLGARGRLDQRHHELKSGLDRLELARIERKEGRSYAWHVRRLMTLAEEAVDQMPRDPRNPGDLAGFSRAVEDFGAAVKDFDASLAGDTKSGVFDSMPRGLLGKLREVKEKIATKRADPTFYSLDFNNVVGQYNSMVTFSKSYRG